MTFSFGQQIGAYRIIRLLGEGGMGAVYEVEHAELGTHYALKTFVYDGADEYADMLLNKFREEAKMLSRINHPNVSRAFDLTHDKERGILYYVMDLVLYKDGESYSLGEVDRASLTEDHVYRWFCDACAALDHIHSLGIVHRDVKLDNFLLNPDKHAVLADFGVSRIFGKQMKKDVAPYKTMRIKRIGSTEMTVLGSDHYIAPEVLAGQEATPAADAYGLGVMIFKLFTDDWADKKSPAQVDAFLHGYKYRWYKVIPRLLEFDPAKRPTKFSELIGLLDREPAPVAARPKVAPSKRRVRRVTLLAGLIGIISAVLICGGLYTGGKYAWEKFNEYQAEQNRIRRAQYEAQLKAKEEQDKKLAEMEKRIAAQRANVTTQVVTRVVEDDGRDLVAELNDILSSEPTETKKPDKEIGAPRPKEKKDEFVVLKNEIEKPVKDYGPIPNKTYTWLKGGNAALPQEVKFELSNEAVIDLVPLKAATFYMSNDWRDGRTHHKVTLTRPFWMSKYLLTADQCRDFAPNDYEDCRPIEKALADTPYTVSVRMDRRQIDAFCKFLSEKYRAQLPKGYVFRLPTEAEWEYAYDREGTVRLYEDKGSWVQVAQFSNRNGFETMRKLRKEKGLDKICEWQDSVNWGRGGGYTADFKYFVGGRMKPFASGIHDLHLVVTVCLDVIDGKMPTHMMVPKMFLAYDEIAVDPLRWVPGVDIYSAAQSIRREWDRRRCGYPMDAGPRHSHIVLGPDLIAERAWETCRRDGPKRMRKGEPIKMFPAKWAPSASPRKLNSERKYSFALDNGVRMDFCLCPAGKFNMSNIDGDVRRSHRVTLTKPFLVSKFNVTAAQWRDFGPYDCEGVEREMEKLFKKEKYPICVRRNYIQWTKFCEYLTEHYRGILPKGYVFRLPTEAELEWAMVADEIGDVRNLGDQYDDALPGYREAMARLLDKRHFPDVKHFDTAGFYRECYIGGRSAANVWGMCDFRLDKMCLDLMDADRRIDPSQIDSREKDGGAGIEREWAYGQEEVDPVRWHGRRGVYFVRRSWRSERRLLPLHDSSLAHIVIAPDILADLKRIEEADYPLEDFGGTFLGDKAKVVDVSSGRARGQNSLQRWQLLLSRENVIVREKDFAEDWRGCHTDSEASPWVQIELDSPRTITGLQIESFRDWHCARHLRVWVSDGGKEMPLVAKEDRMLQRFRFDFQGKNIKAKYIRIGREPGFMKDWFFLNKVLIYGR